MVIEQQIAGAVIAGIKELYGAEVNAAQVQLQKTKKEFKGHLTLVVFPFLRMSKKSPEQTAQEIGEYLVKNFDNLLCIGLDCLSLGSVCNDYATEAHHWLLGYYTDKFITVIEDMKMSPLEGKEIESITVLPLRMIGIDSSPVTIVAEVK